MATEVAEREGYGTRGQTEGLGAPTGVGAVAKGRKGSSRAGGARP